MSAADEKDIKAIETGFNEAWNRHDPDGMVKSLGGGIPVHHRQRGLDEVTRGVRWLHAGSRRCNRAAAGKHARDAETTSVSWRPDVAMVHSHFRISGDIGDDGKPESHNSCGIRVVHKRDGRWFTVAVQNTDVRHRRT